MIKSKVSKRKLRRNRYRVKALWRQFEVKRTSIHVWLGLLNEAYDREQKILGWWY